MSDLTFRIVTEYILDNYIDVVVGYRKNSAPQLALVAPHTKRRPKDCNFIMMTCTPSHYYIMLDAENRVMVPRDSDINKIIDKINHYAFIIVPQFDFEHMTRLDKLWIQKHTARARSFVRGLRQDHADKGWVYEYSGLSRKKKHGYKQRTAIKYTNYHGNAR